MANVDFIQLVKPVPLFMPTACELPSDAFLLQLAKHAAACLRCVLCGGCTLQFWICKRVSSFTKTWARQHLEPLGWSLNMADVDFIQLVKPVPLFMPTACELPSDAFLLQFAEHAAACLRCVLCGGCTLQFRICKRVSSSTKTWARQHHESLGWSSCTLNMADVDFIQLVQHGALNH